MFIRSFWRSALLLAAIAALISCHSEKFEGTPDGGDCECSSTNDNYCDGNSFAMQCLDGCHFTADACDVADCDNGCSDGECWMDNCDDAPECEGEDMNYCADETTLMVCHTFPDEWDNYYEAVDCYDPENCDCGSGCAEVDDVSSCWCCETDGGTGDPDAGVDAGE